MMDRRVLIIMKNESLEREVWRTYSELCMFDTLEERFQYLRLNGEVGEELFGYARYLNQEFYHGAEWRNVREQVIIRDRGYDLGVPGWKIVGHIYVHHLNPITLEMLKNNDPIMYDPENLISCSYRTHQAITLGSEELLPKPIIVRRPNDTCPWRDEDDRIYSCGRAVRVQS